MADSTSVANAAGSFSVVPVISAVDKVSARWCKVAKNLTLKRDVELQSKLNFLRGRRELEQAAAPEGGHPWSSWVQVGVGGVPAPTPLGRGAAILGVTCSGDSAALIRPCVDCGLWTGRFCDWCLASDRMPEEQWAEGQLTPLCSTCDNKHDMCHFCRGLLWCMPAPWGHISGTDLNLSDYARRLE